MLSKATARNMRGGPACNRRECVAVTCGATHAPIVHSTTHYCEGVCGVRPGLWSALCCPSGRCLILNLESWPMPSVCGGSSRQRSQQRPREGSNVRCHAGKQGGAFGHGHAAGFIELAGEGNGRPLTVSDERNSLPLAPHSVLVAQDDGPATARRRMRITNGLDSTSNSRAPAAVMGINEREGER
jgi:hypothetical protein